MSLRIDSFFAKLLTIAICFVTATLLSARQANANLTLSGDSLERAKIGCARFKGRIAMDHRVVSGTVLVPRERSHGSGKTIPLFWWK